MPLDVGESGRANPGKNYRQQHKAIQEAQDAHNGEHGEVVEPECMISTQEKKNIIKFFLGTFSKG